MICYPNAKINIGLSVVNKRKDGYHNIETIFYPISFCDILEIVENNKNNVNNYSQSGLKIGDIFSNNLCLKAYQLIAKDINIPNVNIHLHKQIPIGAGLGGGSSDAAYTLITLNSLFNLGLSNYSLKQYAEKLGSDCALFIDNNPQFGEGRGEILYPININLTNYTIVLVKPDINVSTVEAYSCITPQKPIFNLKNINSLPIEQWRSNVFNDFENTIFKKYKQIEQIKDKLYNLGSIYCSMSGSGSTVFGIFKNIEKKIILNEFKNCFIWVE